MVVCTNARSWSISTWDKDFPHFQHTMENAGGTESRYSRRTLLHNTSGRHSCRPFCKTFWKLSSGRRLQHLPRRPSWKTRLKDTQAGHGWKTLLTLLLRVPDLLRNLLRNPIEPDLALHQSLPTWPGSAPKPPRPSPEPSPEPDLVSGTVEPDLEEGHKFTKNRDNNSHKRCIKIPKKRLTKCPPKKEGRKISKKRENNSPKRDKQSQKRGTTIPKQDEQQFPKEGQQKTKKDGQKFPKKRGPKTW